MAPDPAGAAAATPNPERAEAALRRVLDRAPEAVEQLGEEGFARLAVLAAVSAPLVDAVARHERVAQMLVGPQEPRDAGAVARDCARALDAGDRPAVRLAVEQRAGLVRVAVRDLLGLADTPQIAEELADLAQGILTAATDHVTDGGAPLAVIGMGKLGGRELNYVSDVDVIFVAADGTSRRPPGPPRRSCGSWRR